FIILFFTIEALNVLKLDVLNSIGNAVLVYIPFLVSATIILGVGFFVANLLDQWIRKYANSPRSEEHTSELQSRIDLVCRLLLGLCVLLYLHSFPTRRSSDLIYYIILYY